MKLIALVATAVMVDGERRIIQPGQPLPDLQEPDRRALLGAKAAREAPDAAQAKGAGAATGTAATNIPAAAQAVTATKAPPKKR